MNYADESEQKFKSQQPDQGTLHAGSLQKFFNHLLPSGGANVLLPASKGEFQNLQGEVQNLQSENDQQNLIIKQQNLIINQLVKQVGGLTPVSGFVSAAWCYNTKLL